MIVSKDSSDLTRPIAGVARSVFRPDRYHVILTKVSGLAEEPPGANNLPLGKG
jgi:hypothetical protein